MIAKWPSFAWMVSCEYIAINRKMNVYLIGRHVRWRNSTEVADSK